MNKELYIKVGKLDKSILWCTVEKKRQIIWYMLPVDLCHKQPAGKRDLANESYCRKKPLWSKVNLEEKKVKGRKYKWTASDVYRSKKYIQFILMKKFLLVWLNRCREGIDTGKSQVNTAHIACSKKVPQAAAVPVPGDRHKMERNCGQDTEDCIDEITVCRGTEGIPSNTMFRRAILLVRNCKCRR